MATAQQIASAGVYVSDTVGLEVTDGNASRVLLGLISGTNGYGLKVVAADGTTVIIDGTSDMFRISATGTLSTSSTQANDTELATTVTLTALGTVSSVPAFLAYINVGSTNASYRGLSIRADETAIKLFAAAASGGATTSVFASPKSFYVNMTSRLDNVTTGQVQITLDSANETGGLIGAVGRYYVLAQVSI